MKKELLNKYTFLYMMIPTIIFLFGWCKIYIALILTFMLILLFIKRYCRARVNIVDIKNFWKNKKIEIIGTVLLSLCLVFVSGIGGFAYQNADYFYRNAVFEDLINEKWPVIHEPIGEFESDISLVYYFAFWLPSALIGKIFNITVGYVFLYIWSTIGVFLTFSYLRLYYKKNFIVPILMFVFFSGLDIIEHFLMGSDILKLIHSAAHLERATGFQFSSFTTQLFWVFNQSIPAWLWTLLILNEEDNRTIGINIAISLIFCTLPSMGLAIIAIYKILFEKFDIKWIKSNKDKFNNWLYNICTVENIIIGIPLLLIFASFIKSNISGGQFATANIKSQLFNLAITIFFEFLIYYLLLYKYQKKNKLFYLSLIMLLICPFFRINGTGDFCMRVSIPALVILFILILESLESAKDRKDHKFLIVLAIIMTLGSITPLNEVRRSVLRTHIGMKNVKMDLVTCKHRKNFYGYVDQSAFYKYFAKK